MSQEKTQILFNNIIKLPWVNLPDEKLQDLCEQAYNYNELQRDVALLQKQIKKQEKLDVKEEKKKTKQHDKDVLRLEQQELAKKQKQERELARRVRQGTDKNQTKQECINDNEQEDQKNTVEENTQEGEQKLSQTEVSKIEEKITPVQSQPTEKTPMNAFDKILQSKLQNNKKKPVSEQQKQVIKLENDTNIVYQDNPYYMQEINNLRDQMNGMESKFKQKYKKNKKRNIQTSEALLQFAKRNNTQSFQQEASKMISQQVKQEVGNKRYNDHIQSFFNKR